MRRTLLIVLLAGCGAAQTPAPAPPAPRLADLEWLTLGPWQTEADAEGCFSVETWQRIDDTRLTAQSIAICSADSSTARVTEEIVFEERADGTFYVASPVGQERTEFRLTEGDASHFVAENLAHDFPTRIAYRRIDDTHLEAVVAGPERSFTLTMTRAADAPLPPSE